MNLLALDTSTGRAALAVVVADSSVHTATPDPSARHGRALVPAIRALVIEAGLTMADLDALAVGLGPGSYTGLRVGLTAVKTLAYALGKPLVSFDSLEAIARNAPGSALRVSVIADAQRGDLYVADFARTEPENPLVRDTPTRILALESWAAGLMEGTVALGPAFAVDRLSTRIPPSVQRPDDPESNWPDPRRVAALALDIWNSGRRDDVFFLEPLYLRRSAAEDQWEAKGK